MKAVIKLFLVLNLALIALGGSVSGQSPKSTSKAAQLTNADCLSCHADGSLTKEVNDKTVSLQVKEEVFKNSVHGQMFQCVDCHKDIKSVPHASPLAKVDCAQCHADEQKVYDGSLHAKAIANGDSKAARCADCHGNIHEVLPSSDPRSPVAHANVPKTCGSCHSQTFIMQSTGVSTAPSMAYQESVHGKLAASGNAKAAVCSDCHTAHDIRRAGDPGSSISKLAVAQTCAKCHEAQKAEFMNSIHGVELSKGNLHSASCTDCHGIHLIKSHTDPTSAVAARNLASETCAQCHQNSKMTEEFGVPGNRASTFLANYHGMATEMGSKSVASCASCHTAHSIRAASDPQSSINKAHLVQTCAQCHPGATEKFAAARIHAGATANADIGTKAVAFVRRTYLLLIFATIGFMVLHNLIILRKKLADRMKYPVHHVAGPRVVVRMTVKQRIQHAILFVSFFTLVFTGFALKYPDSWLASIFVNEVLRSWVHRIAGSLLILVGFYHVYYLAAEKEGRKMFLDMLPVPQDAFDLIDVFMYYLGFSQRKPQFRRFNYAEKMEYWSLVWGTIVMALTGLMAWFKVQFGAHLPGWFIDVAIAVHFYEAILATLSIFVWHFYAICFDPDTYPLNFAFLDGKVSLEHYEQEHALDLETIKQYSVAEEPETVEKE